MEKLAYLLSSARFFHPFERDLQSPRKNEQDRTNEKKHSLQAKHYRTSSIQTRQDGKTKNTQAPLR